MIYYRKYNKCNTKQAKLVNIMFTELKNNKCTKICATSVVFKEMKIEISKGYDFFENESRKTRRSNDNYC